MTETTEAAPYSTNVVTSDNLLAFQLERINRNKPPEDAPPVVEEVKAEEPPPEPPKPKNKIEERFSEMAQKRRDAEAKAEAAEKRAQELEAKLAERDKAAAPAVVDPEAKPTPAQFTDAFEYAAALADWSAKNALRTRDKEESESREAARRQEVQSAWQKRAAEAKAELPDYDEVVASSDLSVSDQVRDAIMESDVGPKLVYHLASNPELAAKINGMTVIGALRTIGKLEATLEKAAETPPPAAKSVIRPPAPIAPIRAASVPDDPIKSDGEFTGSYSQWKALRKAGRVR